MKIASAYKSMFGKLLDRLLSLLVVFLLISATAVWTGKLFGREIGIPVNASATMATNVEIPNAETLERLSLSPKAIRLTPRDSASWQISEVNTEKAIGIIIHSGPYAQDVQGFSGPTPLYIFITDKGIIKGVAVAENTESPDFLARAESGTLPQWKGLTLYEGLKLKVDAVSGATYSSRALIANMQAVLKAQTDAKMEHAAEPLVGWAHMLSVAAVLLVGLVVAWRFKGNKWLRMGVLLLNVAVVGFWCGQFLSLSLLRGWIAGGLDPLAHLPVVLMLGVACLLPFLGRPRYYCTWVCPYGSLQELAWRLPLPKIRCSARTFRIMRRVRMGVLSVLLLLLWSGMGVYLLDYEPFSAFLLSAAPPAVMVLAGIFVVAGCFVPNVWCKSFCPLGALFDLTEK